MRPALGQPRTVYRARAAERSQGPTPVPAPPINKTTELIAAPATVSEALFNFDSDPLSVRLIVPGLHVKFSQRLHKLSRELAADDKWIDLCLQRGLIRRREQLGLSR